MYELLMQRCLDLARNGMGSTCPNPLVGAVILHNGKIIGEGYHQKAGEAHAEVNAINSVYDKSLLPESTLYVNLEPCSHFGQTPPCASLIIKYKIPRVVVAAVDTSSQVSGRGIAMLKDAGCEVTTGVLENESRYLNRRFFTFHEKQRPYIILKWAKTLDGFIDSYREVNEPPVWITNQFARMLVHKWRSEESAILAGRNTLLRDNPFLTVRDWAGRQPVRVAYDKALELPPILNVFNNDAATLIFTSSDARHSDGREYIHIDGNQNISVEILKELHRRRLNSLIVEGGRQVLGSFIAQGYWDEARVFTGNKFFASGIKSPDLPGNTSSSEIIGDSKLEIFLNS